MMSTGRNDPCPCGSGKKFKKCCMGYELGNTGTPPEGVAASLHTALANFKAGAWTQVESVCHTILQQHPAHAEALTLLGLAAHQQGRHDEAEKLLQRAMAQQPSAELYYNLGVVLQAQDKLTEAVTSYRQSCVLTPNAAAYGNLGSILHRQGQLANAASSFRQAIALAPTDVSAMNNLGTVLQDMGQAALAMQQYQQALAIKPDYAVAHSALICAMDLVGGVSLASQQAERQRWYQIHAAHLRNNAPFKNQPEPQRRLRIGYVSADFRRHSAATVFGAMLTHFNREAFAVYGYSNAAREDAITAHFKAQVTHWHNVSQLSDEALTALIRQDEIDILVDLSGHSVGNRLCVFARKPAPLQITAWGYASSTGLATMDAFLADAVVVPAEEKALYTEAVHYLPNLLSAHFFEDFPPVTALPAQRGQAITFASFNRLSKSSAEVFALWAQILHAVPGSRLLLKTGELDEPAVQENIYHHFAQTGIAPERLVLRGKSSWFEHLSAMQQVDIGLDTFPHGGGVTTLEMLRMGVPVLSLRVPTVAGRLSASILNALALNDWVADSPQHYVELATAKAAKIDALAALRQQLRPRFDASCLGDTRSYVAAAEQVYRQLWQRWCEQQA